MLDVTIPNAAEPPRQEDCHPQLNQLAIEAQRHPPQTIERQLALTRLIQGVQGSGKLYRPTNPGLSSSLYDDLCDEAIWETWLWISKHIDRFDPSRGHVLSWINTTLYWRFRDRVSQWAKEQATAPAMQTEQLELLSSSEESPALSDLVRQCLEADPEQVFSQECIRGYATISFRAVALRRLSGQSWEEISVEFNGAKISTLSSFYQRSVEKLAPRIKSYIQEHDSGGDSSSFSL